ncbi:MAG: Fic family protein [Deltaproteobacteria bacterium]|jgi:Fic family protein|nr:Fic family protein [Deltaproteobacteria bacterium]
MRLFDYKDAPKELLTPDIVLMLTGIHEHKGKQDLFIDRHPDVLTTLLEMAMIQSTGASNRIEGIVTTDKRLMELVKDKSAPRNRSEAEIMGYCDVLASIHEGYAYITPRTETVKQLHSQLYSRLKTLNAGQFKVSDNIIAQIGRDGGQQVRFIPVPAFETGEAMIRLFTSFSEAMEENKYDTLLLIPMFVLDFLCIHPFRDGNGRISRLLTLLLLYRAGYVVGKYISLEKLTEKTKDLYYEALEDSSGGWHENTGDYKPFVRFFLSVLQMAYRDFERSLDYFLKPWQSKPERIKEAIDQKIGQFSKAEIMAVVPDISKVTVERTFGSLVKTGYIVKIGAGRSTIYAKNPTQD